MADEFIRLDTTIIAIYNLINEAATGTMARTLFKAKDVIYNQQRYVIMYILLSMDGGYGILMHHIENTEHTSVVIVVVILTLKKITVTTAVQEWMVT